MTTTCAPSRLQLSIRGAVQGVGFRPFVYRLAKSLGLSGWVSNSTTGVLIEVEGVTEALTQFRDRLCAETPPRAAIWNIDAVRLPPIGDADFSIHRSDHRGDFTALVLPDIAVCAECAADIFDPANRRYRYPFTNCTNCGPRFSIVEALPYDRAGTTMKHFRMCDECRAEYEDPRNRRFHAQPNACPACGPRLTLLDADGGPSAPHDEAIAAAVQALKGGRIVAVKGLGGFHLMVNAEDDAAVRRLRRRKNREEKPFAIMFADLAVACERCEVTPSEAALLQSPESPIVLLPRQGGAVSASVAPDNPYLGVMLPYTPLHKLLLADAGIPLVATSGNRSDEPICIDNDEALDQLRGIADQFLVHDRPIARRVDDSVVRIVNERPLMLRRARGYAPLPIRLSRGTRSALAVGAHMKNVTAAAIGRDVFLSQHIGDLETPQADAAFRETIRTFADLYHLRPERIVRDLHPDYLSSRYAVTAGPPVIAVQHHYAHALSCMAEHGIEPPALAIVWDGTGYGSNGTIWGGEFLHIRDGGFDRAAHLRTFRLPGGDAAAREPRRSAFAVLFELFGEALPIPLGLTDRERNIWSTMIRRGVNAPWTSSAGRLFDAAAAILGLRERSTFEGQAAMELEFAIVPCDGHYDGSSADWGPVIHGIVNDVRHGVLPGRAAARFHNSLVEAMVSVAARTGLETIVLSGGCFQNKYLTERAVRRLTSSGFHVYTHERVPPNDGGVALGQIAAASKE